MDQREQFYKIFNSEGRLLQVEYGLEAVNGSYQINTLCSTEGVICISKKIPVPKLCVETPTSVYKITDNIYMHITGLPADIDYVVRSAREIASSMEFTLGCTLTPDVFTRKLASKFQISIQRSAKRSPAFAAVVFGFENNQPMLYYTDMSAICNPVYAMAAGEDTNKRLKYLEKHFVLSNINDTIILGISSLLESIGKTAESSEIEVVVVTKDDGVKYLNNREIDRFLQTIAEGH